LNDSEQLLQNCLSAKDYKGAINKIADVYHKPLYWHIRKIVKNHDDANDVLQNTYIKIFKGLPSFQQRSSVKNWAYRIAYNESINFINREQKKKYESISEMNGEDYFSKLKADVYFDTSTLESRLHTVLRGLSEKKRQIFNMKYFDELKFEEIAKITGWNTNSIKTAFYATKQKIERQLIA